MNQFLTLPLLTLLAAGYCEGVMRMPASAVSLEKGFAEVPSTARPWCYWWWINGHVDKETITADLESMKRLGFGGLLMFDSRGYWDDERHVVLPKAEITFMGPEWQELTCFAIREAARLGLAFTMNISSSGGKLDGPWAVGADAPKRLMCRTEPLVSGKRLETKLVAPDLEYYRDVGVFAVCHDGVLPARDWSAAGDGTYTMAASSGKRTDGGSDTGVYPARTAVDLTESVATDGTLIWDVPAEGNWTLVRFGYAAIPGHDHDVDVLDPKAVTAHFHRISKPLQKKVGDLFGSTLTHFYSVSWEGAVPTWTGSFEADFKKFKGYDIRPCLPMLAGFELGGAGSHEKFMTDFRKARNDMFRENFYGTMRGLAHELGVKWYSESGGPWQRNPAVFREADQLEYLAVNDLPQGEFWYTGIHKKGGRYHTRGAAATAHMYGLPRAAAEAFTHMTYHWSAYPAVLKRVGDEAYADGINHFVWHTFTCSPKKFGVPGYEYFAGTHINRNVTWHNRLAPFITYLGRCQWLLQQGQAVADFAVWAGDRVYQHWGRYRDKPYNASNLKLPAGRNYDVMNTDVLLRRVRAENGKIVLPDGMSYVALVIDPEFPNARTPAVQKKLDELKDAGVEIVTAPALPSRPALPDYACTSPAFTAAHRRTKTADIYFVIGEGKEDMTFRASARSVELWDAVTGRRTAAPARACADGRTVVSLNLPKNGSVFVVFQNAAEEPLAAPLTGNVPTVVPGPWQVSFKNAANPVRQPAAETLATLIDFTTSASDDVRHFAGTATYTAKVTLGANAAKATVLSLGDVTGGVAEVLVNGTSCGIVWTTPWEASVAGLLKEGKNRIEIRFTNTWANRLIGDCALPPEKRVTTSGIRYHTKQRVNKRGVGLLPTIYSGYTLSDPLFPNGVLGPVVLR